jgi:hypothetical protein
MGVPNGGPKWGSQIKVQIRVPNRGPKSGSQIGVLNRGPKSGSQIGVFNRVGVPNGGPKWGCLKSRSQIRVPNRGPKWGSQMGVQIRVQMILAAVKLTRAKAKNIIYFFGSVWYHWAFLVWRQAFEQAKLCGSSRHPKQAICYCSYPPRARRALIFVALIVKIGSCNNNLFFHGLPSKLLQLFYFRTTMAGLVWQEKVRILISR